MGADAGRLSPICERSRDLFRLSQLLSRTGVDAATARPGRVAAIAVVPGCNSSSTDSGHAHGDHSADRLRPCLRPGTLHRRMDRGYRCSRLVPGRDHAAEAAPLKAVVRDPLSLSRAFHITPVLFVPLVLVVILALFKFPPFGAIFIGALVGGVLAVFVAPERVIVFAGASDGTPTWLALASGYVSKTGYPAIDMLVTPAALAFGGVVEKSGVLDRLITPIINAAKSVGALVISGVAAVLATK